jgi:aldose sugar dehydrogenase
MLRRFCVFALLASSAALPAQIQRPGQVTQKYAQLCASCHGANLEGGQAGSMLDDVWVNGGDDESLARSIRNGIPEKGMPAWSAAMSEKEIRAMVIFIREQRARAQRGKSNVSKPAEAITVKTKHHAYQLKTWVSGLNDPWSMTFLPDGTAVITEKRGKLYTVAPGTTEAKLVAGMPEVDSNSQAGLFDVAPHPHYKSNGWLYVAYSHPTRNASGARVSLTRVFRGKLKDGALVDQQSVFEAPVEFYPRAGGVHFGGRLAFDKRGYLFFTIGERGHQNNSQDLSVPMGKVHRVFDDGRVPDDNPFAKDPKAFKTIWSYGHRNPQGLAFHPETGELYDLEHGPRGGDELNLVRPGLNYGWPVITYGMNYDGSPITDLTAKEGMEQPVTFWTPSLAVSGMSFYTGDQFPMWKNHLFIASLAAQELRRLELQNGKVVDEEVIFRGLGRIRHVTPGPDGALYVCLPERVVRLDAVKE